VLFRSNKKAVLKQLGAFKRSLSGLEKLIKEGDGEKIRAALQQAKDFRDPLFQ
jgi:prephenate dehydrogenase